MGDFLDKIHQRNEELKRIILEKEDNLSKAPKGILNIVKSGNRIQYYYKENASDEKRKYLKKSEKNMVEALCQKDYDQKVIQTAQNEQKQLDRLIRHYPVNTFEAIYENLDERHRKYVRPVIIPEAEYVARWEQSVYCGLDFHKDAPEYYTEKGERVRSKTEILIANALKQYHVPYRYECPLFLLGYGNVYPDFTVLNVQRRKEYYWEHLGMMDDPAYAEKAIQKINNYEQSGIFLGERLILTYESRKKPLSQRNIQLMIEKYLK